jgi:hypothetical protein
MRYEDVRDLLVHHLRHSGVDETRAHEIYHDDAVLEFPQSGERFLGEANMQGFRERYPASRVDFELREVRGSGDTWIGEGRVLYDGANQNHFVWIAELRDGLVQRETIYFAEPFPAPDWRKPWAEDDPTWEPQAGLPATIRAGG